MGIEKPLWHHHSENEIAEYENSHPTSDVFELKDGDYEYCQDCVEMVLEEIGFRCNICKTTWHIDCIPSSPESINHPCHMPHSLKLLLDGSPHYSNGKCLLCLKRLKRIFYHCSLCDFSMHVRCAKNPPPLVVDAPKCHEHTLSLMFREDSFTCNACGTLGQQNPYVCPKCALMFHRDCITLPHVININRHDHRVSHTYSLVFGDWECGVCRQKINWRYGAYSCSVCPDYVVHSKCATRKDVWDGIELEGVPEEFVDVCPFKVIKDGVINHFSHDEHNLRLIDQDALIDCGESVRCEACTHPIYSEKHYSCVECEFLLHERCANLPLQKRHGFRTKPLTLISTKKGNYGNLFPCTACQTFSNGFRYEYYGVSLDVQCVMISWYFDYECHPHTLFLTTLDMSTCGGCHETYGYVLHCVKCEFSLCFKCATLPKAIKHRCDDHFLSLCFGEKAKNGMYWCEVCETVLDSQKWFYTCYDCGVVCHIHCVLGEYPNAKPGVIYITNEGEKKELVSNNRMSRPKCGFCGSRCKLPLHLKISRNDFNECYCDSTCCARGQSRLYFSRR